METDTLDIKRYESMKDTLKRGDDSMHDEIYEEAFNLIKKQEELKPHESDLVEAVLQKVARGSRNGRGNPNKFAYKLKQDLDRVDTPDKRMLKIVERIMEMPEANITARMYAAEAIFENPELNVTENSVRFIESLIDEGVPNDMESLPNRIVTLAEKAAEQAVGHDTPLGTDHYKLYKMLVKKVAEGKLSERMSRRFVVSIVENWGDADFDNMKAIKESVILAEDIKDRARRAMESPKPVRKRYF